MSIPRALMSILCAAALAGPAFAGPDGSRGASRSYSPPPERFTTPDGRIWERVPLRYVDARYIAARYVQGSPPLKVGDRTPWGAADHVENVAPGIDRADTPGHGGYRLSEARNADVDGYWRNHNGWYEEDSEWTIAAITHREAFSAADVKLAHESARAHNPDNYMRVVGRNPAKYGVTDYQPVGPGESPVLAARSFFAAHSRDVQRVWSGVSSDTHPGMVEATVSAVKKDGTRGEHKARVVLIPQADYDGLGGDTFHTIRKDAGYQPLGANAK